MSQHGKSVEQLLQTLHDLPRIMSLARNPLLLTIIAYLYTDTEFILPHSRTEFYRKATDVLLDLWHHERNRFAVYEKRHVLQHLALFSHNLAGIETDFRTISFDSILKQIRIVAPRINIRDEDARPLLNEIVERSGLLLRIDGGQNYQFAHLTLQEYFAAAALKNSEKDLYQRFKSNPDVWREPVKLWCGLDVDCTTLVRLVHDIDPITAFACLADAQNIDLRLTNSIIASFQEVFGNTAEDHEVLKTFGLVAADTRPRGKTVFRFLEKMLAQEKDSQQRLAAATALSHTNLPEAAQVIVKYHLSSSGIRQILIRMGDLAIPVLRPLAEKGNIDAMDDLCSIATPKSAKALADLIWYQKKQIAASAAWRLASLISISSIETALRKYRLPNDSTQRSKIIHWIWEPFFGPKESPPAIITGRVAYLIKSTPLEQVQLPTQRIDSRLAIPLVAVELANESNLESLRRSNNDLFLALQSQFQISARDQFWKRERTRRLLTLSESEKAREYTRSLSEEKIINIIEQVATKKFSVLMKHLPDLNRLRILRSLMSNETRPTREDWTSLVSTPVAQEDKGFYREAPFFGLFLISALVSAIFAFFSLSTIWEFTLNTSIWKLTIDLLVLISILILCWQWGCLIKEKGRSKIVALIREYGYVAIPLSIPTFYFIDLLFQCGRSIRQILFRRNITTVAAFRNLVPLEINRHSLILYIIMALPGLIAPFTLTQFLLKLDPQLPTAGTISAFYTQLIVLLWLFFLSISLFLWSMTKRFFRVVRNPLADYVDVELNSEATNIHE